MSPSADRREGTRRGIGLALGEPSEAVYLAWLREVGLRTVETVVSWMRVGFVHGVMNTDNLSVLGHTIDYGPYGWLEGYEPDWTPNTTDASMRRYCFGRQPRIAMWNLFCFANAIYPLVGRTEPMKEVLAEVEKTLERSSLEMVGDKLGLTMGADDEALWSQLESVLQLSETDMTLFFRGLSSVPTEASAPDEALLAPILRAAYVPDAWEREARASMLAWLRAYGERARSEDRSAAQRKSAMDRVNPKYVLRNYLAQVAIDAAEQGDPGELLTVLDVMRRPYSEQPQYSSYAAKRPEWARNRPGCSTLSYSS